MSQILNHKIDADKRSISEILKDLKFIIDYFQREYCWQEKQQYYIKENSNAQTLHHLIIQNNLIF